MNLNLNLTIRVKLNELGKKILIAEDEALIKENPNLSYKVGARIDQDDYVHLPMWELMEIFGRHLSHGSDMPFVDGNIELPIMDNKTTTALLMSLDGFARKWARADESIYGLPSSKQEDMMDIVAAWWRTLGSRLKHDTFTGKRH